MRGAPNLNLGEVGTHHSLRVAVPWTNHEPVPDLVQPELPSVMEA